ncbi:carboxypeptidase regulatory-like domain-containing protein [Nocardiopsis eucommiae]|uniref:Carboxypeptidase regulatory-like domain-containing protein n=1 Tax=Nocardiopsis eucommiae TaxID=2831970 RepID=A0A975QK58_9ACTN|nr:carboxypeptidase regulatory-like domain-containing protein [Nocardiopsis eucommiae]
MRNDPDPRQDRSGRAAALAAFDRSLDEARMARAVSDSAPSPEDPLQRDGRESAPSLLGFDLDGVHLDLQVRASGGQRLLSGLVRGDFDHVDVRLRRPDATLLLFVGMDGRFDTSVPPGPLCLVVECPGRPLTVTDWFTV